MKQKDVADRLHVDLKTYQNLENGKTKFDLNRLADFKEIFELASEYDLLESEALYLHQEIHRNTNIFNKDAIVRDDWENHEILKMKDSMIEKMQLEIDRLWDIINKLSTSELRQ